MARLATSQRASELFERMRGVGLGSQTHGLSGVHHIQVRAQAARVHLVNAGVVAVYQCCVWDATLGDAKLVKRPELARSLVLNAAADSHSRLREPPDAPWMGPLPLLLAICICTRDFEKKTDHKRKHTALNSPLLLELIFGFARRGGRGGLRR